jgi:hypothetical protein
MVRDASVALAIASVALAIASVALAIAGLRPAPHHDDRRLNNFGVNPEEPPKPRDRKGDAGISKDGVLLLYRFS